MPYNLVAAVRDTLAVNWNALPPGAQYGISSAAAAASVPIYDALTAAHADWHQVLSSAVRMAVVALICHRLPKPQGKA